MPCLMSMAGIISIVVFLLPVYGFSGINEHYHIIIVNIITIFVAIITIFPFSLFLDMAG